MGDSNSWGRSRVITLVVVLALHAALLALLLAMSRNRAATAAAAPPIELLNIPHVPPPRIRALTELPRQLRADVAMPRAPPTLDAPTPSASAAGTASHGAAVNWAAEAHRAVQAFEIRRDQPADDSQPAASPWDGWWPQRGHHAGDRFKTDSGDWIVWINADCYQVASWHAGASTLDQDRPQTYCPGEAGTSAKKAGGQR